MRQAEGQREGERESVEGDTPTHRIDSVSGSTGRGCGSEAVCRGGRGELLGAGAGEGRKVGLTTFI